VSVVGTLRGVSLWMRVCFSGAAGDTSNRHLAIAAALTVYRRLEGGDENVGAEPDDTAWLRGGGVIGLLWMGGENDGVR